MGARPHRQRPGRPSSTTDLFPQRSQRPPRLPGSVRRCPGPAQLRLRARLQLPSHPEPTTRRALGPAPRRGRRLLVRGEASGSPSCPPGTPILPPLRRAPGPPTPTASDARSDPPLFCFHWALRPSAEYVPVPLRRVHPLPTEVPGVRWRAKLGLGPCRPLFSRWSPRSLGYRDPGRRVGGRTGRLASGPRRAQAEPPALHRALRGRLCGHHRGPGPVDASRGPPPHRPGLRDCLACGPGECPLAFDPGTEEKEQNWECGSPWLWLPKCLAPCPLPAYPHSRPWKEPRLIIPIFR